MLDYADQRVEVPSRGSVAPGWMAASKAADLQTVLSLMADDVVFLVPGQKPFGKETFASAFAGMKDLGFDGRYEIEEIQILGDWAYLRDYLEVAITPPGQEKPMRRAGYTLTILRREPDGRWVIARDANLLTTV